MTSLSARAAAIQSASRLRMLQAAATHKELQKQLKPVSNSIRTTWADGQGPTSTRPV
jgi:hypothetical protein